MKNLIAGIAVIAAVAASPYGARGADDDVDTEALYKKAVKSTVFIVVPTRGGIGMGSGSLLDVDKKIVLTNYHVVGDSDKAYVQFPAYQKDGSIMTNKQKYLDNIPAGNAILGKVLYTNKSIDLAIVQVEKVPPGTPAIKLAGSSVSVGHTTWNLGSPGAVEQVFSITEGKVRAIGNEKFRVGGGGEVFEVNAKFITTTNPSNPGDSGGPLIDKRGFQVGVTQSGRMSAQLVSRFVDVMEVRAFLKQKGVHLTDDPEGPKVDPKSLKKGPVEPKKESVDPESEAATLLRRAALFAKGEDNRDVYMDKLKDIIKKYPDTQAAKDAQKILSSLKK